MRACYLVPIFYPSSISLKITDIINTNKHLGLLTSNLRKKS